MFFLVFIDLHYDICHNIRKESFILSIHRKESKMPNSNIIIKMKNELMELGLSDFQRKNMQSLTFEKGEYLCKEGYEMDYLMIIAEGKAKSFIEVKDERKLLMAFYTKKSVLGEVEIMTDGLARTSVQAVTQVICLGIPIQNAKEELKENVKFMNFVSEHLAVNLDKVHKKCMTNMILPMETRLCSYILMGSEDGFFYGNLKEVAELLGTSYRHLLRTLDLLIKEGLIEKVFRGYKINKEFELERRAGNFYSMR